MIVDLYLVYSFVKRLATPFNKWEAYKLGIIDEDGNVLRKRKTLKLAKERDAFGLFDVLILNVKKVLAKVPGGSSRLATYAAALYLIKEQDELKLIGDELTEEQLTERLNEHFNHLDFDSYPMLKENNLDEMFEETMSAGSGMVAGIGIGPKGEPGVTPAQAKRYKKKNKSDMKSFKEVSKKES